MSVNLGTAVGYLELNLSRWNRGVSEARRQLEDLSDSSANTSNSFQDIQRSTRNMSNEFTNTSSNTSRFNREMQRLSHILGGEVPQATRDAYQEMYRLRNEQRRASRAYGSYSQEAMSARNALTEFALGLDDTTFKQVFMRSQLGLSDAQLQQQANSIKLNARMTRLMGNQTQILTQRMEGLQRHGIKPEMLLPASTPGQFQILNETMELGVSPLNRLSSGYRALGNRVEGVIKKYSAQKVAVRQANGDMVRYGLIMRNLTAGTANLSMAIPIVGVAALTAYGTMFSAAMEADEGLKKLWDTTKNKIGKMFEPVIETAGQFLEVALKVVGAVADWVTKFNEAHPIIAKVASVVALLAPAMTLLLLPLSMGVGLFNGWMVALNSAWTMIGGLVTMIGTATSTFFAFAIPIAAVTAGLIYLYKTNETFRKTVTSAWQAVKDKAKDVFGTLEKYFTETIPNAYKNGGIKGVLDQLGDTFKSALDKVKALLPQWLESGKSIANNLIKGINEGLPALQSKAHEIISNVVAGVLKVAPQLIDTAGQLIQGWLSAWGSNVTLFLDAGLQLLTMIMQGIAQALPTLISTATNIISTILNIITENLPKILETGVYLLNALANGISENLPAIIDVITTTLDSIVDVILQNLPMIIDAGVQIVITLANALLTNLPTIIEAVAQLLIALVQTVIDNLPKIIEAGIQIVVALVEGIIQATPQILEAIWNLLTGVATIVIESLEQLAQTAVSAVTNAFIQFAPIVQNKLSEIWNSVTNWCSDTWNTFIEWCSNIVTSVGEWFSELPYKIGFALGSALGTIASWGVNTYNYFATNIPLWIDAIGNWFSELPGKIWTWLSDTYNKAVTWGSDMKEKATETGKQFVNNAITSIQQLPGKVWNWLNNTIQKAGNWASQMKSKAQQAGSDFLNKTSHFIQQLPGKAWTYLNQTISKASNFASQFSAKGQKAASDFKDKIVAGVKSIPSKMLSIGADIVKGIWNGISGAGGWLKGKISGFADGVVAGFKSTFKIKSPSRIMRDLIGVNLVRGIGVGMENEEGSLLDTVKSLAANLVNTMTGNIDVADLFTMAKSLSDDVNFAGNQTVTNNKNSSFNSLLHVDTVIINDDKDIEELADDLAFYLKRKDIVPT